MGGIDETSIDRLSLVTEMTKHIRVRASGGRSSASELGHFSPVFVWLLRVRYCLYFVLIKSICTSHDGFVTVHTCSIKHLWCLTIPAFLLVHLWKSLALLVWYQQDFYLDLSEDNRKITPRDYLELALRPVQSGGRDVSSKNAVWWQDFLLVHFCLSKFCTHIVVIYLFVTYLKDTDASFSQHIWKIRESIRALFPDRECFTLVRPVNNEKDLQRLDQLPVSIIPVNCNG